MSLINFASFLTIHKPSHKHYLQNTLRRIDVAINTVFLVILLLDPAIVAPEQ